jgi:hypothetical protein
LVGKLPLQNLPEQADGLKWLYHVSQVATPGLNRFLGSRSIGETSGFRSSLPFRATRVVTNPSWELSLSPDFDPSP